jgi:hypothetical protein
MDCIISLCMYPNKSESTEGKFTVKKQQLLNSWAFSDIFFNKFGSKFSYGFALIYCELNKLLFE